MRIFSLLISLAALAVSACTATPPPGRTGLSFAQYQPIYLNVANIEFIEEYRSPFAAPNVEHVMPYSPAQALKQWTDERLRATGQDKMLQVIVKEGGVVESSLDKTKGVKGLFTVDQDKKYDATLEAELRIYGPEGGAMSLANVSIRVARSTTVAENASPAQRDEVFRQLIAGLMESANAELERNMFQYFGGYINFSRNP